MAENQLQHLLALGAGTAFQFVLGSISPPKDLSKPSGRNMAVCDNEMLAGGRIPSSVLAASPPATHPWMAKELFLLLPVVGTPTPLQPQLQHRWL